MLDGLELIGGELENGMGDEWRGSRYVGGKRERENVPVSQRPLNQL